MNQRKPTFQLFNESESTVPLDENDIRKVAALISRHESCRFDLIEVVYVSEEEIIRINREHLDNSYLTDIITFRYDENTENNSIEGTLFNCAPRIIEQASEYGEEPETEFYRVLIHGFLHLAGYDDSSEEEKAAMRKREDFYLNKLGRA